jgi:hypothetical protein
VDPSAGSSTGLDTTTTGETAEGSTTGEPIDCSAIDGIEGCQMHEICIWLAEPGECTLDPCLDAGNDCWAMEFAACSEVLACAWNSENPEVGDCAPISCVPCGLLTGDQCSEVEGCVYNEPKMLCVAT